MNLLCVKNVFGNPVPKRRATTIHRTAQVQQHAFETQRREVGHILEFDLLSDFEINADLILAEDYIRNRNSV